MKIINWFKENYWLAIILLFGAFLRFYHLDYQSVWLDEIHTINEANPKNALVDIYNALLASEPHPPLYFILVQLFFKVFGYKAIVLKFFSALIGTAGLYGIYALGKELMNKQVGLIATLLLSVNYFHIYYSQEGRMYALLFFTTVLSFLFLIKFIKKPTLKSAFMHGLFAVLMIYSHFFALFALVAQYLIVAFFIAKPFNTDRKKMLLYSALSGITTLLLYIPSLKLFIETTKKTSIWIPMPSIDAYTQIFKEFFGQSEIVIFFTLIVLIMFFIKLYNSKENKDFKINPYKEKQVFSFVFLFSWIIITLLIPLISSYVKLPMLISRYFINILPALILVIAIGIYYIKSNIVKLGIVSIFLTFSLTDVIIVKKYYKTVVKTQFREATQFILDNNSQKNEVVTSLGWYLPYFLNNEKDKNTIVEKTLDVYVSEMSQDDSKIKEFWYFDGHIRPYAPTETTKAFLEQHFIVDKSIDLYDCYTKHFILKGNYKPNVDISKFMPLQQVNGDKINYSVENFDASSEKVFLSGWAYFDGQGMENAKIDIIAVKAGSPKAIPTESVIRDDVTTYFKSAFNLSNSGFKAVMLKTDFEKGNYQIGVLVNDITNNKKGLVLTDKAFVIE